MRSMAGQIRILLVESSPDGRRRLGQLLGAAEGMAVVAEASTDATAKRLALTISPDVIVIGGSAAQGTSALVASIMETAAAPIVALFPAGTPAQMSSLSLKAGAVAVLAMPADSAEKGDREAVELLTTVRAMSEVPVVARREPRGPVAAAPASPAAGVTTRVDVVAIGASTGGPQALFTIMSGLPKGFPLPVLIVQHMADGFQDSLLKWLNQSGGVPVRVAAQGEVLAGGIAYLAPDEYHMGVDSQGRVELSASEPEDNLRPAVGHLFRSVRHVYGPRAVGVLLSGMGRDGAEELKLMRDAGATTIVQDEASCAVFGMPKEAIAIGGASRVLSIDDVAPALVSLVGPSPGLERWETA